AHHNKPRFLTGEPRPRSAGQTTPRGSRSTPARVRGNWCCPRTRPHRRPTRSQKPTTRTRRSDLPARHRTDHPDHPAPLGPARLPPRPNTSPPGPPQPPGPRPAPPPPTRPPHQVAPGPPHPPAPPPRPPPPRPPRPP